MSNTSVMRSGTLLESVGFAARIIALVWIAFFLNVALHGLLYLFGLQAHSTFGAIGIATAPFLHRDIDHITGNTEDFLILSGLALIANAHCYKQAVLGVWICSGVAGWLLGPIGSGLGGGLSGVTFGLMGFLCLRGLVQGQLISLLATGATIYLYHGSAMALWPMQTQDLVWIVHTGGFASGVIAALVLET